MAIIEEDEKESIHAAEVSLGIILILCSLICLGTWPTVMRLCSISTDDSHEQNPMEASNDEHSKRSPFAKLKQLKKRYGQNRHPCHVYLDYAVSYMICSSFIFPSILYVLSSITRTNEVPEIITESTEISENEVVSLSEEYINSTHAILGIAEYPNSNIFHFDQLPLILIAMMGGSLLAIGNMTMQWSTTAFRAPLTTVLALQGSTCVAIGTYWNYRLQPEKTGKLSWLFIGVAMFLCAILTSILAQHMYILQSEQKPLHHLHIGDDNDESENNNEQDAEDDIFFKTYSRHESEGGISLPPMSLHTASLKMNSKESYGSSERLEDVENIITQHEPQHITHRHPQHQNYQQNIHISNHNTKHPLQQHENSIPVLIINDPQDRLHQNLSFQEELIIMDTAVRPEVSTEDRAFLGIIVAIFGGVCFGFFSPFLNISVNDPFHWTSNGVGLNVTFANSYFAIAFTLSSVLWNIFLMKNPPSSTSIAPTSIRHYLEGSFQKRYLALLSGFICALGNMLQFQGGSLAGFAAADIVQAYPLIATIWDVFVFQEFSSASLSVMAALGLMYLTYIAGILFLAGSIA